MKVINRKALSKDDLKCLQSEIDILSSMDHPHIIKYDDAFDLDLLLTYWSRLYEVFDEGNSSYIVMEMVHGGELFDRIVERSGYTEKNARDLIKIFLDTVAYMHDANVVHRDLKPENLLLSSSKRKVYLQSMS